MRAVPWSLLLVATLLACATSEQGIVDSKRHSFRVDSDSLRARYGPVTVGSANVPFDRTYAQLTPDQQRSFNGWYERMNDTDEPPFPLEGLRAVYGPIAEAQLFVGVQGHLFLEVVVDSTGTPQEVRVFQTPNPRIARTISAIAMQVRFKPAMCEGRPCGMSFPISVQFKQQ